jgi:hypothetical protein
VFHPVPSGPNDGKTSELERAVRSANEAIAHLAKIGAFKDAALVPETELSNKQVGRP